MKENSFFHSDLKVVLVVAAPASSELFTFCLLGLSDLDDSAIFIFLCIFPKIRKCPGADPAFAIRGGSNSEHFLSNLRKQIKEASLF